MKKQIKDLQTKTASEAHLLYEALVGLIDEGAEKVASANEVALNYVKSIGEAADSAHLFGLSAVCQQTCQNSRRQFPSPVNPFSTECSMAAAGSGGICEPTA